MNLTTIPSNRPTAGTIYVPRGDDDPIEVNVTFGDQIGEQAGWPSKAAAIEAVRAITRPLIEPAAIIVSRGGRMYAFTAVGEGSPLDLQRTHKDLNANHGGVFEASPRVTAIIDGARMLIADHT